MHRSCAPLGRDVTDGAEPLGEEAGSDIRAFWIARRQTDETGRFGYKQKSENGYVQTDKMQ